MGIFDIFKKGKHAKQLGPAFLDGLTEPIVNPEELEIFEWRRQLKTTSGQTKFKIKFYGELLEDDNDLIVATDFAPALVFATDNTTGQDILLFDGCKHGYNAMFCDTFTDDQIKKRPANNIYKDEDGSDNFEVIVSVYYQFNYDDEAEGFLESVDDNGLIELIDGSKIEFEKVKRNGFDVLQIFITNENGKTTGIVSEELA